jgi:hypothetical protein
MAGAATRRGTGRTRSALTDPRLWSLGPRPAPIDIAAELCRAMDAGRFRRRGATLTQTVYAVTLAPADLARFDRRRRELVAVLKDTLGWWAEQRGYELPGELRVRLVLDSRMRPGRVGVEAGLRSREARELGRARGR